MKKIGIFFGSRTPEHDVSIITAQLIIAGLRDLGHEAVPIYIGKNGRWYIGKQLDSVMFFKEENKEAKLSKMKSYHLDMEASTDKMVFFRDGIAPGKIEIDLAFPALHGANGEDGTVQGVFELVNVPYVGCGVASSAVAMDKILTKIFFQGIGIPTVDFVSFDKAQWDKSSAEIMNSIQDKLDWPVIVKPARLGSSIGIAKAGTKKELELAIEVALHYDDKALVEKCVQNLMDVTCAVIGNDEPRASLLQESLFRDELFSYQDKYLDEGGAQTGQAEKNIIIPARLDEKTTQEIQEMSRKIFKGLGCSGIARFDFLYDKVEKRFYANEINTIPGTLYHHLWKKSGLGLKELLSELIRLAEERYKIKNKLILNFDSKILDFVGAAKLKIK
ncbi:MAG TPA: D-alanine--D-alanine ligase family protein [Patescibacteria group bacterium]|nr:D-alanine--D-alanine ligase family protein [Patescibacteria group bacterium]